MLVKNGLRDIPTTKFEIEKLPSVKNYFPLKEVARFSDFVIWGRTQALRTSNDIRQILMPREPIDVYIITVENDFPDSILYESKNILENKKSQVETKDEKHSRFLARIIKIFPLAIVGSRNNQIFIGLKKECDVIADIVNNCHKIEKIVFTFNMEKNKSQ